MSSICLWTILNECWVRPALVGGCVVCQWSSEGAVWLRLLSRVIDQFVIKELISLMCQCADAHAVWNETVCFETSFFFYLRLSADFLNMCSTWLYVSLTVKLHCSSSGSDLFTLCFQSSHTQLHTNSRHLHNGMVLHCRAGSTHEHEAGPLLCCWAMAMHCQLA